MIEWFGRLQVEQPDKDQEEDSCQCQDCTDIDTMTLILLRRNGAG